MRLDLTTAEVNAIFSAMKKANLRELTIGDMIFELVE